MNEIPRFMIAAPSSGSGKTLLTCGIMRLLQKEGYSVQAFKCGPDYIDPMFHTKVLGISSVNLDSFFVEAPMLRYLFCRRMKNLQADSKIAVIEGVMGYYDGLAGKSAEASSYDIARITDTPVILVVDVKGMSLSVVPYIKGFLEYVSHSHITGVIFNRCSKGMFPVLKQLVEEQLPIEVLGYLPVLPQCEIPSRHLGLYLPQEIADFQNKIEIVADTLKDTLDVECLCRIASQASEMDGETEYEIDKVFPDSHDKVRIAIAKDDAFCFYYQDNLDILEQSGAELVPFSPIHDKELPPDIGGLLLGGGYPENFAEELSRNHSMLDSVRSAIKAGIPCLAECGGFLYLHDSISDINGQEWNMAGVIGQKASYQGKLQARFGYITVTDKKTGIKVRGHEFHYYDSTDHGSSWEAVKPLSSRHWDCMHSIGNLLAGFPHLYYASNIEFVSGWVGRCRQWKENGIQ